jgi:hypothetical protein
LFDETNGSQVEQVDLDELDEEEASCIAVTPQCHLGFFSILAQVPSFHVSKIEQEASNQLKNKRSTKLHLKNHVQNKWGFEKGGNIETLIPTLNKPFK